MNLIRRKWWRSVKGEVTEEEGFAFEDEPDTFYFRIDPETQTEQLSEDDPRIQHVDDLHETRETAVADAIGFLERKIALYRRRLDELAVPKVVMCATCGYPEVAHGRNIRACAVFQAKVP